METIIRSSWLRRSGTIWASIALILLTLFSPLEPTEAASRSERQMRNRQNTVSRTVTRSRNNRARAKVTRTRARRARARGRWIEVNLRSQRLTAWENGRAVYSSRISSGKSATPTRRGTFYVQSKHRSARMRGRDYNVPNVPYTMYYSGGYAIHGAYWHNRFGTPVSHGCVNLPVGQARRLFSWAGTGTKVVVR